MEQSLRHQYLETMGIVSWLPRRQLPGARPTPDWVWEYCWPEDESSQSSEKGKTATASFVNPADRAIAAKQARAELSASFDAPARKTVPEKAAATPAASTPQPVRSPESAPKPVAEVVEGLAVVAQPEVVAIDLPEPAEQTEQSPFKLAFMAYQDCLVIDSLPPVSSATRQGSAQADAHHQILLDKILRSIGFVGGSATDYYTLPWPMFASKSLDQGAEQARLTVQHKLKKSLEKNAVKTVLLLGESAAQMVLEREESLEQLRGMLFSLRSDVKTLASASLTEMMMLPGCKREVWSDLQPLLDHLQQTFIIDE
ncbi:hypothetical protein [Amphritea japonica]|uniref:Uracil-DNA glycosylase-like domain-containing protein n=1 Tax=Amphritea japonica ATCC BAA-1530 TaxID=1278309 RepID=A0A7R6PIH7_9GAMM|nr:hypothetical protein [Amphritea japonica]BBB25055.1 conserved hypothetical protein [Amphritea japonica ATCC BAA-1530]